MSDLGFVIDDLNTRSRRHALLARTNHKFAIINQKSRLGVTLIELLIAIAIIATLSAVFLGASRSAMESARAARTKTTISKLHTLLMEQYASYMTRTIDLAPGFKQSINGLPANVRTAVTQDMRLLALREQMKYEMPDHWSDLNDNPVMLFRKPAVASIYDRRYQKVLNWANGDSDKLAKVVQHQAAECLYLTIMYLTGDGEARTLFSSQDIGDTDGDGAPEFLDGWGNPIAWVRWPAGFVARSSLMAGDTTTDHDPFDPFKRNLADVLPAGGSAYPLNDVFVRQAVDQLRGTNNSTSNQLTGFRLVPLIYSSGPDGISDINTAGNRSIISSGIALDPYAIDPAFSTLSFSPTTPNYQTGLPSDGNNDGEDNSVDNIHNHVLDNR
ncbi:prepilin-type N-terminal cleavage/methylation domain-containing protein [Bythopirellula polymerisocia]|uniref:Type II secretion system protein G n=1 Tax=Bythopirellula polymerisocia TaxID=2528003 RepID=A0A5C6CXM1_9BACT|nr:prepilin-type N-terminal cleavage/methylation domain-containing protein [Bythopirellula polymerisocia]TWU28287.1 hypothetical protein Pla144_15740 [Bythopirellula polymerisocia]